MITEVMKISEPPYTNRGVTRQKEDLTALIDWCQITVKGVDVFIIIEDILRIPLSFMELHGKEKGIAGHELIARFLSMSGTDQVQIGLDTVAEFHGRLPRQKA